MKVLSLGWGVQSFTVAAMAALGEIEKPDCVLHADTTHEASWTYAFAKKWSGWLEIHGLNVITVKPDEKKLKAVDEWGGVHIPAFTSNGKTDGQLRRQCTGDWKIDPTRRWLQAHRDKKPVEMWIGLSVDESQRMKVSDVQYITNRYPLIELKMTRDDCIEWLINHDIEVPKKSSCVFCPYHDKKAWRELQGSPVDWRKAVEHDLAIRKACPPYDLFVHQSRTPLGDIDFRTEQEKGQMELDFVTTKGG